MTSWDERARAAGKETFPQTKSRSLAQGMGVVGFEAGARWQREALLSDESVERAARALDKHFNPDKYPVVAAMFRDYAATALRAAIGDDDE